MLLMYIKKFAVTGLPCMKVKDFKKKSIRLCGLCIIFILATTSILFAQRHTTARNMGLGGGGTAYIDDFHANFINPANLMLNDKTVTVGLFGGFSTAAGGGLANLSIYDEYFTTGRTINEQLTGEISDKLFGSGNNGQQKFGVNADAVLFGLNVTGKSSAVSAAVRMRALSSFSISKGFFELGMGGLNEHYFTENKNVNVAGDVLMVGEISVGYARKVWSDGDIGEPGSKRLFAGVAPKLLMGIDYYKTSFNSQLSISEANKVVNHQFKYELDAVGKVSEQMTNYYTDRNNNLDPQFGDYLAFDEAISEITSLKGTGLGLDLGITYEMVMPSIPLMGGDYQTLSLSFSATDLGSVEFDQNPGRYSSKGNFAWSGLNYDSDYINAEHDSSFSNYTTHVQDSISKNVYGNFSPENISGFKVDLTPMINIGAAYSVGRWNVMVDIGKGLNSRGMNSKSLSSILGLEYNLFNIIPLRAGMRTGGHLNTAYSLGTGINFSFLELTIGAMTSPDPFHTSINIGAAWSGLIMRF